MLFKTFCSALLFTGVAQALAIELGEGGEEGCFRRLPPPLTAFCALQTVLSLSVVPDAPAESTQVSAML